MSAHEKMDRMYRYQRYFYDVTRKYYLPGRDRLIAELDVKPGQTVLEIGCGTARNLAILAGRNPQSEFFGIDASSEMLRAASQTVRRANLENLTTRCALADSFSYRDTFGLNAKFDKIFFSYSISMIGPWRESIDSALENLRPGGTVHIVDFYDQRDLPGLAARLLRVWLSKFHVKYPEELRSHLEELEAKGPGKLKFESIFKSYAFLAEFEKAKT